MELGIVADTHDNLDVIDRAVDRFEAAGVERVIHCGDVIAPFAAEAFDADFAFDAVRGNNDGEWALAATIDDFGTHHGECATLELRDRSIAVYHGTSEPIVEALLASDTYDYVFRGHTHERTLEAVDGTVHCNPGGIAIPPAPGDPAVAIVDLSAPVGVDAVRFEHLG